MFWFKQGLESSLAFNDQMDDSHSDEWVAGRLLEVDGQAVTQTTNGSTPATSNVFEWVLLAASRSLLDDKEETLKVVVAVKKHCPVPSAAAVENWRPLPWWTPLPAGLLNRENGIGTSLKPFVDFTHF